MARPKAFDETEALDAAMSCFWDRGFEGTSVRDLTECMGIASPSLYNAFGDKRSLFKQALERYCRETTYQRIARLEAELPARARVGAFLAEVVAKSTHDPQRRGCFLINSAIEVAPHDTELGSVVDRHLSEVRDFFQRSLSAAQAGDELSGEVDCAQAAAHLMAVLLGIRVLARTRPDHGLLADVARAALAPLGLADTLACRQARPAADS